VYPAPRAYSCVEFARSASARKGTREGDGETGRRGDGGYLDVYHKKPSCLPTLSVRIATLVDMGGFHAMMVAGGRGRMKASAQSEIGAGSERRESDGEVSKTR